MVKMKQAQLQSVTARWQWPLAIVALLSGAPLDEGSSEEKTPKYNLKYEKTVKADEYIVTLAWFPDNEHLAIRSSNGLKILDTKNGVASAPLTPKDGDYLTGFRGFNLSVTPDGNFVIATGRAALHVFQAPAWVEVASVSRDGIRGCYISDAGALDQRMFAPAEDSSSVWALCPRIADESAAVQLALPELTLMSHVKKDDVRNGRRSTKEIDIQTTREEFLIQDEPSTLLYLTTELGKNIGDQGGSNKSTPVISITIMDLDTRKSVVNRAQVTEGAYLYAARYGKTSKFLALAFGPEIHADPNNAVADLGVVMYGFNEQNSARSVFPTVSRHKVEKNGEVTFGDVPAIAFDHQKNWLLSAAYRAGSLLSQGHIELWDLSSLARTQSVDGPKITTHLAISKDKTRVALPNGKDIEIFSIEQKK